MTVTVYPPTVSTTVPMPDSDKIALLIREKSQLEAEVKRLGRCNEQLSRSHAEVVAHYQAEVKRLKNLLDHMSLTDRMHAGQEVEREE